MNTPDLTVAPVHNVRTLLKYTYALVPIVAGADKFLNLLTDWPAYAQSIENLLPVPVATFMKMVGVNEIIAGILVFRYTRLGALLVAAWLTLIAVVLIIGGMYDIAVRDLVMAIGAFCLAQLYEDRK